MDETTWISSPADIASTLAEPPVPWRSRHASSLAELFSNRSDLRGVHAFADALHEGVLSTV